MEFSDKVKNEANEMIDFYSNHPQISIGFTECISFAIDKQEKLVKIFEVLNKYERGLSTFAYIEYCHARQVLNYLKSKL